MKDTNGIELKNGMLVEWKRSSTNCFDGQKYGIVMKASYDNLVFVKIIKHDRTTDRIGKIINKKPSNLKAITDETQIFLLKLEI